jgi:hypothetical protein
MAIDPAYKDLFFFDKWVSQAHVLTGLLIESYTKVNERVVLDGSTLQQLSRVHFGKTEFGTGGSTIKTLESHH